jgi:hypothetical protein
MSFQIIKPVQLTARCHITSVTCQLLQAFENALAAAMAANVDVGPLLEPILVRHSQWFFCLIDPFTALPSCHCSPSLHYFNVIFFLVAVLPCCARSTCLLC